MSLLLPAKKQVRVLDSELGWKGRLIMNLKSTCVFQIYYLLCICIVSDRISTLDYAYIYRPHQAVCRPSGLGATQNDTKWRHHQFHWPHALRDVAGCWPLAAAMAGTETITKHFSINHVWIRRSIITTTSSVMGSCSSNTCLYDVLEI